MNVLGAAKVSASFVDTRWAAARGRALHVAGVVGFCGLYVLSLPPWGFAWLAPIALAGWMALAWGLTPGAASASGLAFGTVGGVMMVPWLSVGFERLGAAPVSAIGGTFVVAAALRGLPWMAFGVLLGATRRWRRRGARIALLAAAAVLLDLVRSTWWGPPWGLVGHSQAGIEGVAQLARVGGVPLVSAIVVALAASLAAVARDRTRGAWRVLCCSAGAYLTLAAFGLPVAEALHPGALANSRPLDVLMVQPNLHPRERWAPHIQQTNLAMVARQTEAAVAGAPLPDLVVWPENTLTVPIDEDPALFQKLLERVRDLRVPVVLGAVRSGAEGSARFSALWVDPERGLVDGFDKTRAIPGVESDDGVVGTLFSRVLGLSGGRTRVEEGQEERPVRGSIEVVAALCYEILFPGLTQARRTDATAAIVNLANDSWFLSAVPSAQQIQIASFRAIEQRLWLVRAVHGGASAVIDPFGRVVATLGFGERGTLRASVVPQAVGGWREPVGLVALVAVGALVGLLITMPFYREDSP